jgi:hypothetical protein
MGPEPFSAPEPRAMADFISNRKDKVMVFMDVHAYSQLWMYPYGASCTKNMRNEKQVRAAALAGAEALKSVNGKNVSVAGANQLVPSWVDLQDYLQS